jgi:exosome complex RNA-binding protein Csl4
MLLFTVNALGQGKPAQKTKTIVGDLLMIDRDLYIVRGERGEIQIEATYKTEITEEFEFGDRIKALVLMNNKALKIERAGANDVPGVVENQAVVVKGPPTKKAERGKAKAAAPVQSPQPKQPDQKIIIADLLEIDRDLYIVRGERGEIQIEATYKTEVTEEFEFGDRIKALVLMNNRALKIERAGPNDVLGITILQGARAQVPAKAEAKPSQQSGANGQAAKSANDAPSRPPSDTRVVEGQILMVDGNFYVLRGDRGEIRVERTDKTKMSEEFKFGDFIKATVKKNDQALTIERLK